MTTCACPLLLSPRGPPPTPLANAKSHLRRGVSQGADEGAGCLPVFQLGTEAKVDHFHNRGGRGVFEHAVGQL